MASTIVKWVKALEYKVYLICMHIVIPSLLMSSFHMTSDVIAYNGSIFTVV